MKKFIYASLLTAGAVAFTACGDLDAPTKSSLDAQVIFTDVPMAEKAVMSIHQSFGETNSYRGRFLPYYGLNTDLEWINSMKVDQAADGGKYDLALYNAQPSNNQMNNSTNAYAKFYEGIERANQAIRGLRQFSGYTSNPQMAQLLGEALTLRAVVYLDLIKGWGDVPARFEPITSETMYLPRTDRDVIYAQLLADLLEAEDLVGWPNQNDVTKSVERINKSFVKGLRARIALYAGGYSQRANGNVELSKSLDRKEMYKIAKDECLSIIYQGSNKLGEFEANFRALCQEDVSADKESLWEVPFSSARGRVLYTYGIKHLAKDQYTDQPQGGVNGPLPYVFYDYDKEDIRRDITCIPYEWSNDLKAVQQIRKINSWCFGKLRYEWMSRRVTSTNDDGINWQYMRLADVYLMAAEAVNELDGPAAAAPYMKPILDRVLPAEKVDARMAKYSASKEAFFEGIVNERAFEFAGEMLRKADLIRWNLLKAKLDEGREKLYRLANREGEYEDLPENIWWKNEGEKLVIYGMNHGEADADQLEMDTKEWTKQGWIKNLIKDGKMQCDNFYLNNPDKYQYWPIWSEFINTSNGMLDNNWLNL